MNILSKRWLLGRPCSSIAAAAAVDGGPALAGSKHPAARRRASGRLTGLLPGTT